MHHPAAVPEGPGRAVGDFTKGSAQWLLHLPCPGGGHKRLAGTGVVAEASSLHQMVTQKPAWGGGRTPGKAKPLCICECAWGVCVHACAGVHTWGCTCVFPQPGGIRSKCKDTRP